MNRAFRALPLLLAVPALTGCGGISLPAQPLPDVDVVVPVSLRAGETVQGADRLFREQPLFDKAVDSRLKSVTVSGEAKLNAPATTRVVVDVLLAGNLSELGGCLPQSGAGHRLCASGGQSIGKITVEQGQTVGTVNLSGAYLTQVAHQGGGHLGLKLEQGRLDQGETLLLHKLMAYPKAGLF